MGTIGKVNRKPYSFHNQCERYDAWYDRHADVFHAELAAIKSLMPNFQKGLEIGVGTGRFAAALGIRHGVDPEPAMLAKTATRGIDAVIGVAESLPYCDASFDMLLLTTTICFLDDIGRAFREARRVIEPQGRFIVAFIEKDRHLGKRYQNRGKAGNPFYANAHFVSTSEVIGYLESEGFAVEESRQTLLREDSPPYRHIPGYGNGAFIALRAKALNTP